MGSEPCWKGTCAMPSSRKRLPSDETLPIRRFVPATDVGALVRFLKVIAVIDGGEPTTEAVVRERLAWPGHDPAQDRWVALSPNDPTEFVAHGFFVKGPSAEGADVYVTVHPAWRRQGVGTRLLEHLAAAARARGAIFLGAYADEADQRARRFLAVAAFRPVSHFTTLHAPAGVAVPEAVWPAGYRVCGYDTMLDLPTYVEAVNRSYSGLWGHRDVSEDDVAHFFQQTTPRLDGIFLLFGPSGEIAGFCRTELNAECSARYGEPTGYIDSPGLTPEHRHMPLRRPLLLTAWRWLRANDQTGVELESFGDDVATLGEYAALSFVVTRRLVGHERRLVSSREV